LQGTVVKTSELTGEALDWAVATCEGEATGIGYDGIAWGFKLDGKAKVLAKGWAASMMWNPSTSWALGGPIIEHECISVCENAGTWVAGTSIKGQEHYGPTPLIAAMRTYVASHRGEQVEVPVGIECLTRLNEGIPA
jgi:hypothetical protein